MKQSPNLCVQSRSGYEALREGTCTEGSLLDSFVIRKQNIYVEDKSMLKYVFNFVIFCGVGGRGLV